MQKSSVLPGAFLTAVLLSASVPGSDVRAGSPSVKQPTSAPAAAAYFESETEEIAKDCLVGISSRAEWISRREEYRRQLFEMLGLWPVPERTKLRAVVTGKLEQEEFVVEKLHFQAMPRLYVTGNLYLPRNVQQPVPAVLYVCGHGRMVTNGISTGNKSWYQHHGAWFARNGYVCLIIDTLQLGEIQGVHHGTYREGRWWWNARGYTPAGVEAWFGIRALDYLCSRPEVDKERIGMTGRSGGGSYTWSVAALDERVKVAAPVAGMTDLRNQVVDGVVDGHCDCMFFLNKYRWDFPQLAALIAPRPLLIANSDKDSIFPLEGVARMHQQTRRIYQLYGQAKNLGLLITEGPHADTQDLQLPVFRWFNRHLKQQDPPIEMAAKKFCPPIALRVFDQLPSDELNTKIEETFVPNKCLAQSASADIFRALRQEVFAGWPAESFTFEPTHWTSGKSEGLQFATYDVVTQPGIELRLYVVAPAKIRKPGELVLTILDDHSWTNSPARGLWLGGNSPAGLATLRQQTQGNKSALAFFAPRLVPPGGSITNQARLTQVRRRYMLLGQTLDGMRVWDIRCAMQALTSLPQFKGARLRLHAQGAMGVNAAYAALFEPAIKQLELSALPASHMDGPDYLNVLKLWDIPQMLEQLSKQAEVKCLKQP